jgi:hypothetical protein
MADKKKPEPRSVAGAAKTETTGNTGKVKPGQRRYSSGAPARGTQTRKDILADMQKLVKYVKTGKFKNYKEKQKVWSQIDNYRVALGTLKESKRKSKSDAKGVTTYGGGAVKVRKEEGFSKDTGRGGGRKSTQNGGGSGKGKTVKTPPAEPARPTPIVGSASGGRIVDGVAGTKDKEWRKVGPNAYRPWSKNPIVGSASGAKIGDNGSYRNVGPTKKKKNIGGR